MSALHPTLSIPMKFIEYTEHDMCPFKPSRTEEDLLAYLGKKYYTKPYDRFMWWRSYTSRTKPLPKNATVEAKAKNGDYDESSFRYEIDLVEHRLRKKFFEYRGDYARLLEEQAVELARRKRLREDLEKDEAKKLEELYKDFSRTFGIDKKSIEDEILNAKGDTVYKVYKELEKKFK